jgi:hypothetical protein
VTKAEYVYLETPPRLQSFLPGVNPSVLVPTGPATVPSPFLPFDMPTRAALAASPLKVFTHYFVQFPISVNDKTAAAGDFYSNLWLPPGAFDGKTDWRTWGGWIRDRPIERVPSGNVTTVNVGSSVSPTVTTKRYTIDDKITEIAQARAAGFDGFTLDITQSGAQSKASTNPSGGAFRQWRELVYAVDEVADPTFKIVAMPDGATGGTSSVADLTADMVEFAGHTSAFKNPSGNLVVAPYGPEFAPAFAKQSSFWPNFYSSMKSAGQTPDLVPCFSQDWLAAPPAVGAAFLNPYSYMHSRWGLRNPVDNASMGNSAGGAAAYCAATFGKPWMAPVSVGDERAKGAKYDENWHSENLRVSWTQAINQVPAGCQWVQIPTWNDYSESAHIAPSRNHGYCILDISSYYLTRFKLGYWPTIVRDAIYLSHRVQFTTGTAYTAGTAYTTQMVRSGNTPAHDTVEALVFATDAGTVTISAGGTTYSQDVAAGVTSVKCPLQLGEISATFTRAGTTVASVTSLWPVTDTQTSQDMQYRFTSSLRGA